MGAPEPERLAWYVARERYARKHTLVADTMIRCAQMRLTGALTRNSRIRFLYVDYTSQQFAPRT